jgi:hypothetical protein
MKLFVSWKMAILLGGLGAALSLAPGCRAQEINLDHFDGTDSWETARKPAAAPNVNQKAAAQQTQVHKTDSAATMKLASDSAKAPQPETVALQDKRKAATQKTKKQ